MMIFMMDNMVSVNVIPITMIYYFDINNIDIIIIIEPPLVIIMISYWNDYYEALLL